MKDDDEGLDGGGNQPTSSDLQVLDDGLPPVPDDDFESEDEDRRYENLSRVEQDEDSHDEETDEEECEGDDHPNEFQLINKYIQFGQNNNDTTHFTRSRDPVLSNASAFAAMEEVTSTSHPKDFVAARRHPRWKEYLAATRKEMLAHHHNRSFEVISEKLLPAGANVINTGMIYADKVDGMTQEEIIKARLCAKGFAQIYGVDFTDTYAPTVDAQCTRGCIAFAVSHGYAIRQLDVDAAFLIPSLPESEVVYSRPPAGFDEMCKEFDFLKRFERKTNSPVYFRWLKSVYGLKNASFLWNKYLAKILRRMGFKQEVAVDPCLYTKRGEGGRLYAFLLYHVDDILLFGKNEVVVGLLEEEVRKVLAVKLMGQPIRFIGIEFHYCANGDVILHQESYLKKLLQKFGMEACKPAPSPTVGKRLEKEGEDVEEGVPYREAIGGILWAAIMTRPDLLQAVTQVAQYTSCLKKTHWQAIKRILRYICGTTHYGILFRREGAVSGSSLVTFSDADHAGDPDRRSCMGSISFAWGAPIAWVSKKIRSICISAHESELIAMSRSALSIKWQVRLMTVLDGQAPGRVQLLGDNQGAMVTAVNGIRSKRSKHIEIADLFVLQAVEDRLLEVKRVNSADNMADFLTKPLGPQKFIPMIKMLEMDGRRRNIKEKIA